MADSEDKKRKEIDEELAEDAEDLSMPSIKKAKKGVVDGLECPYLGTIDRKNLDFDFEKLCSVSLSNTNVYACLVCGKYFQGRGHGSHVYFHALQSDHHIFMNLQTSRIYCIPDGYEVRDSSLEDIQYNLHPSYSQERIKVLDSTSGKPSIGLDGVSYLPGCVGLNNLKRTEYVNVIIQALARVAPLRNFFMLSKNLEGVKSPMAHAFGELMRKIWNPRNFKGHVSPHELMQAISVASDKKYKIGDLSDPMEFLTWFLNTLHASLGGTPKKPSIVTQTFQGRVHVVSQRVEVIQRETAGGQPMEDEEKRGEITETKSPFMFLSLDLPAAPLFKDDMERNLIPQIPLFELLKKYDGVTETTVPIKPGTVDRKKYVVEQLPPYIVFQVKRFSKNLWFTEKNPTIVTFPVKNLDLRDYVPPSATVRGAGDVATVGAKYDLVANICHEGTGKSTEGTYRGHILNKGNDTWYEMNDLIVKETIPQSVSLTETYIQIYERKSATSTTTSAPSKAAAAASSSTEMTA